MTLAIIDLGYGNIGSIALAFDRLGARPFRTVDRAAIAAADHVVLPGVGAAGFAMERLRALDLAEFLPGLAQPVLGICLGMQLLFEATEEGETHCLGIIGGKVRRLQPATGLPVPNMGWCRLTLETEQAGLTTGDYVYFAHSFACENGPATLATVDHVGPVPAVVRKGNFMGAQFHPERSAAPGTRFLKAFLNS